MTRIMIPNNKIVMQMTHDALHFFVVCLRVFCVLLLLFIWRLCIVSFTEDLCQI